MSSREFFHDAAKDRVREVVAQVEAQTSVELVVAVHPSSGHYRHSDYLFGAGVALTALLVFVYHPHPFRSDLFPIELTAAFLLGTLVSAGLPRLRRLLTSVALMESNVARTAKATFVDLGVSDTRARTGVLVFVSFFERTVDLVMDRGVRVDEASLAPVRAALTAAIRRADLEAFYRALLALGPVLAQACPRSDDDVNELDDAPRVA